MHDVGYTLHADETRAEWDELFLESPASEKMVKVQKPVSGWLARLMYQSVRSFGSCAWVTPAIVEQYRFIGDEDLSVANNAG